MNPLFRLRRALLALLFACGLAAAQAYALSHEFAHWAGKAPPTESHSCADCLLGHALDTPLAASLPVLPLAQFSPSPPTAVGVGGVSHLPLLPRARGPPA